MAASMGWTFAAKRSGLEHWRDRWKLRPGDEEGHWCMAIYRDVAITGMVGTIEDAMRQVLDCWAELPPEMQDAIDQFRVQLGAAIDSVYVVKRALDQEVHESERRLD
jgi:hypothetical protein